MSKTFRSILPVFAALLVISQAVSTSAAQDIEATLTVDTERSAVRVEGRFLNATAASSSQPLVFLSDYAGIRLPNERIRDVKRKGTEWSYEVDLTPMKSPAAMAHISWVAKDKGLIMLADLLPLQTSGGQPRSAKLRFVLPNDLERSWAIWSSEMLLDEKTFSVNDAENAVFYLRLEGYPGPLASRRRNGHVTMFPQRQFDTGEAGTLAEEIFTAYRTSFRGASRPVVLTLLELAASAGTWEADTRGTNITIVSSDMPFKAQSFQRLHEQLRHEMFHLWIPEGVNLTGNYDWFYEGFALYQSLKLGVAVNRLRFEDYLDSLNQAYAIDRRLSGKASLIDASKTRWSGDNNSVVYARGMLVAFLSDLAMLEASKGKRSTDDIVREVYQKHSGTAAKQDGNSSVIAIMKQHPELVPIIERYVTGSEKLDWTPFLSAAGLEATGSSKTALTTVAKPNGRQKKLLDKLGYNNWRKLSSTRK